MILSARWLAYANNPAGLRCSPFLLKSRLAVTNRVKRPSDLSQRAAGLSVAAGEIPPIPSARKQALPPKRPRADGPKVYCGDTFSLFLSLAAALPQNFRGESICIQNLRIRQPPPGTGSMAPSGAMRSTSGNSSKTTISPTMETRASWQAPPRPPIPCGRIYRRSSSRSGPRAACWIWRRRWSPALWPMAPAISARPTRTWKRLWVCRPTSP